MACSHCGELCRCHLSQTAPTAGSPRFRVDPHPLTTNAFEAGAAIQPSWPNDEPSRSASQLQALPSAPAMARFIPEGKNVTDRELRGSRPSEALSSDRQTHQQVGCPASPIMHDEGQESVETVSGSVPCSANIRAALSRRQDLEAGAVSSPDLYAWKQEVVARVSRYRRRRPRPPKYPSLQLKFPHEQSSTEAVEVSTFATTDNDAASRCRETQAMPAVSNPRPPALASPAQTSSPTELRMRESGRILEFPRSLMAPDQVGYELAEPVTDRPRIVEVPDIAPPPPALGGIMIESEEAVEKRPGLEIPLQSAPFLRRLLAWAIDALLVVAGCALFAYIFFRITGLTPPATQLLGLRLVLPIWLWAGYQYLCLVWSGSTPGLRLTGMRVSYFDGRAVGRSMRRWRVLASLISLVSLGLGFAWSLLDEDALCWHDRITHTYLAPTE